MARPEPVTSISPRRVFAFLAMVFGMFMAILDIQVVSASLAEIQAGLSASASEISWVQTAYLIAEVVMIPLSGFLSRVLSTRLLFAISASGFTVASFLCATATNLDQMIVYRTLQGFLGGGMIPSVFTAAFTIFPKSKQAIVSPMIGLVATLAPTIGPTIGGYLSHTLSWHWLFLVNVPPGIAVAVATWVLIDFDKPNFALFRKFDWTGLVAMIAFLGSFQYVLEEGPGNDWLNDPTVFGFSMVLVAGALAFFWRAFTVEEPVVDLRAFKDVNFAFGSLFSFVMGSGLYGLTYLYPLYLGQIRGYDSLMIGKTMFVSGLAMFFTAPFAGILARKVDMRIMIMVGFLGFAFSSWMLTGITADWDFRELLLPQILRGVSLMLCMVTINNLALGTLPPERMKNASGLFNLTRNLGGAVGLALINTVMVQRGHLHYARLADDVSWTNPQALRQLSTMAQGLAAKGLDGPTAALSQMVARVMQQARMLSFIDVFYLLAVLFASLAGFALLMRKPGGPAAAAH